ncbi:N-acetylmuramoyl-L-alanine amidase [Timonella senegalensis]|uniref:N-acetylmuramoyl-L-alanine amidase n=1 Tax=Timonella senegalensis TaxID=1465825 RepID=UPI002FDCB70F
MISIKQDLTSAKLCYSTPSKVLGVAIHETANPARGANAAAHARLQKNPGAYGASWNIQVDDKEAIQSYPDKVSTYHAGDGSRGTGRHYVSIEICVNADGNFAKAVDNAAQTAAIVLKRNGLTPSNIKQHNAFSGKNCPTNLRKSGWSAFMKKVGVYFDVLSGGSVKPPADVPAEKPTHKQSSIVDYLSSRGMDSSFAARAQLAAKFGIKNYTGTASQNLGLIGRLQSGTAPTTPSKPASKPTGKTVAQMATEVITGKHGNGHTARQKSLKIDSATYSKVRAEVNRRLK